MIPKPDNKNCGFFVRRFKRATFFIFAQGSIFPKDWPYRSPKHMNKGNAHRMLMLFNGHQMYKGPIFKNNSLHISNLCTQEKGTNVQFLNKHQELNATDKNEFKLLVTCSKLSFFFLQKLKPDAALFMKKKIKNRGHVIFMPLCPNIQ